MLQQQFENKQNEEKETLGNSQILQEKCKLTLVTALNRLKQTEDRIYEAKKKLQIIQMKNTSIENKMIQRSKTEECHKEVRSFSEADKKAKESMLIRRSLEREKNHERNVEERVRHKKKIEQIQVNNLNEKKARYEQAKKEKFQHMKSIQKYKHMIQEQKKANYIRLLKEQKKRKIHIKNYKKNKQRRFLLNKHEDTMAVQSIILDNERQIEKLKRIETGMSRLSINPQVKMNWRDAKSVKNLTQQKGFRVKQRMNQTMAIYQ